MLYLRPSQKFAATLTSLWLSVTCVASAAAQATAEPITQTDQNCVITMNKVGVKLFTAENHASYKCIRDAGKGRLEGTIEACMVAEEGSRSDKLANKLVATQNDKCSPPLPPFGFATAAAVTASARTTQSELTHALFGNPLDAAVVLRDEDFDGVKCQLRVAREYQSYAAARLKAFKNCKQAGLKNGTITDATALAECTVADPRDKVAGARARIGAEIARRCDETTLPPLFPGECETGARIGASTFDQCVARLIDCHTCVLTNDMDGLLFDCDTLDDGLINASCRTCGNGVTEGPEYCDEAGATAACDVDCTFPACGDGIFNPAAGEECDDGNGIDGDGCDLGCILSGCGNGIIGGADEECDDGNNVDGDGCTLECRCEPGAFLSGCQDPQCPASAEFIQMAAAGPLCSTNADCLAGTCDETLGRCATATTDDLGFSGFIHDVDSNDGSVTRLRLTCPGPGPVCGECIVEGIAPLPRNCRCANDDRKVCDRPLRPDADDCGGAMCECYEGPPSPNSAGNTPVCTVWRHASDVTGTVDVDTGAGIVFKDMRAIVHLGEQLVDPCPRCIGDGTPGDGLRKGKCVGGPSDGMPCDVDAEHTSFPAPGGGGGQSLDCMPSPAKNISADGVVVRAGLTTGASVLSAAIECGLIQSPALCACGVCSENPQLACSSNADCGEAGICGRVTEGVPVPNFCEDFVCEDAGGGEGQCAGSELLFCDGILRASGRPFVTCISNADCEASSCGDQSCGACTLAEPMDCFLDEIVTTGVADPLRPVRGASYCIPPSTAGVNAVLGLPGPGRIVRQEVARYICAGDAGVAYTPGEGGCP